MKRLCHLVNLRMLTGMLAFACSKPPCNCDFVAINSLDFTIVDRQGTNLVFGPARTFHPDSIGVLKESNNLTIWNASVKRSLTDTAALRFSFYVPAARSYIYYNRQTKADTLDVIWRTKTGRCCGSTQTFKTIEGATLNGLTLVPQNGSLRIVK